MGLALGKCGPLPMEELIWQWAGFLESSSGFLKREDVYA
jgi:hypothetical protein